MMVKLSWTDADAARMGGLRYNVYASAKTPVAPTPENLIVPLLPQASYTYNRLNLLLSRLHLAVTAIDRWGNESEPTQYDK